MKRIDIVRAVSKCDGLIVCNIGYPSRELYAVGDRSENFYMLGSMGMASSIGLGLALCQDKRVFVIDGDGSVLMNLGTLATLANNRIDNLCLIIVDNRSYGSTGGQKTCTSGQTDLALVARGAGNRDVVRVKTLPALADALAAFDQKNLIIVAEAEPGNADVPVIDLDPVAIKNRFMGKGFAPGA